MDSDLVNRISAHKKVYFFLDFDGTLVDIAFSPDQVCVDGNLLGLLRQLSVSTHVRLAVVSGRSLANLRLLLPLEERLVLVGSHGGEILVPGETVYQAMPPAPLLRELEQLAAQVERLLRLWEGCMLERKPIGLALHYRGAVPRVKRRAVSTFEALAKGLTASQAMDVLRGDEVIELRRPGVDKGAAVRRLLVRIENRGFHPVYFGDDCTDEDAFHALRGKGTTVLVGSRNCRIEVDFRLAGPEQVRSVLRDYLSFGFSDVR